MLSSTTRRRHVIAAAVLAAAAALCTSCSSGGSHQATGPDGITATQVSTEFKAEQQHLTLAPKWVWPADPTPESKGPDGRAMMFGRGYGTTHADFYWMCSWERYYLSPGISTSASDHALAVMKSVSNTEYYKVALLPADQTALDKEISDAGLGDKTVLVKDVAVNCPASPA
ncbi:hypothetical protein ACEZCY_13840 [Streptacidiphilus sp. N1-12]|uniref:Lipoprotein n=2 Tax=Streptacidiphilus alkalitolerans TaxID=3342712 RepID=A0ABV6V9D0_9ACTN